MSKLEQDLGLIELTSEEILYKKPIANNLKLIPKNNHNSEMLKFVCAHDGLALKYASKKLITPALCEIAISQNGLALEDVPEIVIQTKSKVDKNDSWYKELCRIAVKNNGRAIEFVPQEYIDKEMAEQAVSYYLEGYDFTIPTEDDKDRERIISKIERKKAKALKKGAELSDWEKYPIAYIPKNLLSKELLIKAVSYSPFSLKNITNKKITKELVKIAIKNNGLSLKYIPLRFISQDLVYAAIDNDAMAIRYSKKEFLNQEICNKCFDRDYAVFPYVPEEYVTETMCLKLVSSRRFSVSPLSERQKENIWVNHFFYVIHQPLTRRRSTLTVA